MASEQSGQLTVYGAMWCGDCRRTKAFLDRRSISYVWKDVESDVVAQRRSQELQGGRRSIPVVVLPDGGVLVEPSDPQLAAALGLTSSNRDAGR